jgi:hypothetical protein
MNEGKKYQCTATYKLNPYYIIPKGAIINIEPDTNSFLIIAEYKGRNMKLNIATLRKYFKEVVK